MVTVSMTMDNRNCLDDFYATPNYHDEKTRKKMVVKTLQHHIREVDTIAHNKR